MRFGTESGAVMSLDISCWHGHEVNDISAPQNHWGKKWTYTKKEREILWISVK